ncbi:MAG: glyoxylase-like metal-dependent hydrolase (beta-lactamase superfamily II) [Gammaproteobacteria bacterium]|jgi:glyoxylase-like metal-dependent hydrolase (beta-lactamase superfamily II)
MAIKTWTVGNVKITRVIELEAARGPEFGYRNLTTTEILAQKWLAPHFATDEGELKSAIQAFVLESDGHRIIVDTCVGNDKQRGNAAWNEMQGSFLDDLEQAGFAPSSIDTVLCTHLHVDHVGWNTRLVDGQWEPTFPNAHYLFGRTEWAHWSQENAAAAAGDIDPEVAQNLIETTAVNQDSIIPVIDAGLHELVDSDHRVTSEIVLEPTPGHTPGHVSVVIDSLGQKAVITGDLMHHPIQCAMPHVASKFDHDVVRARETRRAFLRRYADREVLVFGTHFADPTAGHLVTQGGDEWHLSVDS